MDFLAHFVYNNNTTTHPYLQIESVDLALNILDGMHYEPGYVLHVERAKFQPKKDFDYTKHRRLTTKEKREFRQRQEKLVSIFTHLRYFSVFLILFFFAVFSSGNQRPTSTSEARRNA